MSFVLTALILSAAPRQVRAQAASDSISARPVFLGTAYSIGDSDIDRNELEQMLLASKNPNVVKLTKSERSYTTIAFIPAFLGGFCVGYGLYAKPANLSLVLSGAICIAGAYVIQSEAESRLSKAISGYNSDINNISLRGPFKGIERETLQIGFTASF